MTDQPRCITPGCENAAVVERDKRIAELEAEVEGVKERARLSELSEQKSYNREEQTDKRLEATLIRVDALNQRLTNTVAERDKRIAELEAELKYAVGQLEIERNEHCAAKRRLVRERDEARAIARKLAPPQHRLGCARIKGIGDCTCSYDDARKTMKEWGNE